MIDILKKYKDIIKNYTIFLWENEPLSFRFKANIIFNDDSCLIIKEYILSVGRKYSFHWQDKNKNIIVRWDNSKHWKYISTYPHHKHVGCEIMDSMELSLEDILNYISFKLKELS